jgi:hypothetical protein
MTIAPRDVMSSHLKPLCSRDNHVMKYEAGRSMANTGIQSSYHCGYLGCSVRYNSSTGYYMLMGMSGHTYAVAEPGVNTLKCPKHHHWLYRRENIEAKPGCALGLRRRRLRLWLRCQHKKAIGSGPRTGAVWHLNLQRCKAAR